MRHHVSAHPAKEQNKNFSQSKRPDSPARLERIRSLNDQLRTTGLGGIVVMTDGLAALGEEAVMAVFAAVRSFDRFNADNDPWGEHDCASLRVGDTDVIWKIDYYDRSRRIHSPDAADPKVTVRVLTVMLAADY